MESMETPTSAVRPRDRLSPSLALGGLLLLGTCLGLYVSGASRAIAIWMLPLAVATMSVGWAGTRGHHVPRWVYLALVIVAAVLAVLGAATMAYSLLHQPVTV